ncbi:MAG: hypothetical protein ACR2HX_23275 [Pyrinomonadaceae bacterium]
MKIRYLICASLFAILLSQPAHSQQNLSADQLRAQIERLTAINSDTSTTAEVKNINRGFLEERRKHLLALLHRKLDALHTYQKNVEGILSASEQQLLSKSISDVEGEIKELGGNIQSEPARVAARPVETAPVVPPAPPTEGDNGSLRSDVSAATRLGLAPLASTATPQGVDDFNNWLSNRIDLRIKANAQAKIDQRSNVNQTEAPAIGDNSTSLVDQSSASDLIGLALNLSGLANGNNNSRDKNSAAVTATAYSLYATMNGAEPLDPSFYNRHRNWRRLSFTLGFEKGQTDSKGNQTEDTTIGGAKYLLVSRRDAGHPSHQKELNVVYENLKAAAVNLAQLNREIKDFLFFGDPTMRDKLRIVDDVRFFIQEQIRTTTNAEDKEDFQKLLNEPVNTWFDFDKNDALSNVRVDVKTFVERKYLGPTGFPGFKNALGDDGLKEIDQFIDARLEAFTNLNNASRRAIENIRRAPQLSFSFMSKLKKVGADEFTGEAIFDYGLHDRVNLTLNGGYFYKNSRIIGGDLRGARFAGQLQFQATPEKSLVGRSPLYFYLASDGNWNNGGKFIYRLQGKVKIPIAEGVELPLSLTFANKKDLINERDVRGQFGFTFDSAKLFRALLSK